MNLLVGTPLDLWALLAPLVIIGLPCMALIASFAVLFESIGWLAAASATWFTSWLSCCWSSPPSKRPPTCRCSTCSASGSSATASPAPRKPSIPKAAARSPSPSRCWIIRKYFPSRHRLDARSGAVAHRDFLFGDVHRCAFLRFL